MYFYCIYLPKIINIDKVLLKLYFYNLDYIYFSYYFINKQKLMNFPQS